MPIIHNEPLDLALLSEEPSNLIGNPVLLLSNLLMGAIGLLTGNQFYLKHR